MDAVDGDVSRHLANYNYRNRATAKRDIMTAMQHYRGLRINNGKFTFNDGTQKDLVSLDGTIPVPFRGANYNIPIAIWVLDTHPMHAPMCFVRPTPDMQIRVSRHVDHNGRVYLPYLHEWSESTSDLLGLIQICIITFSEQPPVFARSSPAPPQPQPPAQPATSQYGQQPPPYPAATSDPYPPQPPSSASSQVPQEHIRASLVTAAEEKVKKVLREEFNTKQVEIESLRKVKEELQESQRSAKQILDSLESESVRLDSALEDLKRHKQLLEQQAQKDADREQDGDAGVDTAVEVTYPLYRQLLDAYVEDAAIDDAVYYLGEALRRGVIDCDAFLKNARNISRRQFYLRQTVHKCLGKANRTA